MECARPRIIKKGGENIRCIAIKGRDVNEISAFLDIELLG